MRLRFRPVETSFYDHFTAAAQHLARYKLPKAYIVVDRINRSASGKPDYAWARQVALDADAAG